MAAVGCGFGAYFLVVIALCTLLVNNILINTRKVGFLKAVKSKSAVAIIAGIVICGGLPALLFYWSQIPRSGDQLFRDFILNPMPKSVEVLDSYDASPNFDPDTCVHFKISPDDFKLILATRKWSIFSESPIGESADCDSYNFPPQAFFDSDIVIYSYVPAQRDTEVMFTNSRMNEVYYVFYDGYIP